MELFNLNDSHSCGRPTTLAAADLQWNTPPVVYINSTSLPHAFYNPFIQHTDKQFNRTQMQKYWKWCWICRNIWMEVVFRLVTNKPPPIIFLFCPDFVGYLWNRQIPWAIGSKQVDWWDQYTAMTMRPSVDVCIACWISIYYPWEGIGSPGYIF